MHVLHVGRNLLRRPLVHRHVVERGWRATIMLEQQVFGHYVLPGMVRLRWQGSRGGRSRARVPDIPRDLSWRTARTPYMGSGALTLLPLPDQLLDRARQRCLEVDQLCPRWGHHDADHAVVE